MARKPFSVTRTIAMLLLSGWATLAGFQPQVFAQTSANERFSDLPVEQRRLLAQRLKSFVEYQATQQWEKQYALLSSLTTRALSRKDYVEITSQAYSKWGRARLLDFVPLDVRLTQVDAKQKVWIIRGCSVISEKALRNGKPSLIEAYWERDNWFFSEIHEFPGDTGRNPCPLDELKAAPVF